MNDLIASCQKDVDTQQKKYAVLDAPTIQPPHFKVTKVKTPTKEAKEGPVDTNGIRPVKLDAIYKPLLRRFRYYFRAKFDEGRNKRAYLYWSTQDSIDHIVKFMTQKLALPAALMDEENIIKMLTLIFPCSTRKPLPAMTSNVDRTAFARVFRENNGSSRIKMFSDPLIANLWSVFVEESPDIIVTHLRRIRSHEERGEVKFDRLMRDFMQLELTLNIRLLPDVARDSANTTVFSKEEKIADLTKATMFKKSKAKLLASSSIKID